MPDTVKVTVTYTSRNVGRYNIAPKVAQHMKTKLGTRERVRVFIDGIDGPEEVFRFEEIEDVTIS